MFAVRERRVARFSNAGFSKISNLEIFFPFGIFIPPPRDETKETNSPISRGGGEMEGIVNDR